MIYYYFASKEALYLQVLEGVYAELGEAESALVLDASRPVEALDQLIAFTWRYYVEHPEFVALLSNENLQRGRHITKSVKVKQLSRPVLDILGTILAEGARQKVFRRDLDVKKVYLTLAALGYFYLSNRYTLSSFLGTDLMRAERVRCLAGRDHARGDGRGRAPARAAEAKELKAVEWRLTTSRRSSRSTTGTNRCSRSRARAARACASRAATS